MNRNRNTLISVIVPAYQAETTISRALQSILAFRSLSVEVIVVDDGSNDATASIVARIATADSRVRLIRQKNGGRSSARNVGVSASKGEWIMFLDSDDYLLPKAEDVLISSLETHGDATLLVFGMITSGDRRVLTAFPDPETVLENHGGVTVSARDLAATMIDGTWPDLVPNPGNYEIDTCWARLYRRSRLMELGSLLSDDWNPFPVGVRFSEDRLFNIAYLQATGEGTVVFEATPVYCWDFGESSTAAVIKAEDAKGLTVYHERLAQLVERALLNEEQARFMFGAQAVEQFRRAIVATVNPPTIKSLCEVWREVLVDSLIRRDLPCAPGRYAGKAHAWRYAMRWLSEGHVLLAITLYRMAFHLQRPLKNLCVHSHVLAVI